MLFNPPLCCTQSLLSLCPQLFRPICMVLEVNHLPLTHPICHKVSCCKLNKSWHLHTNHVLTFTYKHMNVTLTDEQMHTHQKKESCAVFKLYRFLMMFWHSLDMFLPRKHQNLERVSLLDPHRAHESKVKVNWQQPWDPSDDIPVSWFLQNESNLVKKTQ